MITSSLVRGKQGPAHESKENENSSLYGITEGSAGGGGKGREDGLKACALYGYWQQLFYNADNCWRAGGATVTGVAVASGSGARW